MKRLFTLIVVTTCSVLICTSAKAFELSKAEDINHHKMWHKFKRGVINVFTSPMEIPKQIHTEVKASESKVPAALGGTVKGVGYAVGRLGSGLWDMVSFNLAVPEKYEPLMKPDYVCDHMNKQVAKEKAAAEPVPVENSSAAPVQE